MPNPNGRPRRPLDERLWASVEVTGSCWFWTGRVNRGGYGVIGLGGASTKSVPVHRVAYELLVAPIPMGMTIDHLCRTKRCTNPDHMEIVTRGENAARAREIERRARAAGVMAPDRRPRLPVFVESCSKGHPYPENLHVMTTTGARACRACTRERARERRSRLRLAPELATQVGVAVE